MTATRLVQHCAATVPTSVHYVRGFVPEILNFAKNYVHYVLKYVKPVLRSAASTPTIMQLAKRVLKLAENVQRLVPHVAKM